MARESVSQYRLQKNRQTGVCRVQKKEYEDRPCGGWNWRTIHEGDEESAGAKYMKLVDAMNPDKFWETTRER